MTAPLRALRGFEDVAAALLHVVFGPDGDRLELRLRPHDMLQRGAEAVRELSVGH